MIQSLGVFLVAICAVTFIDGDKKIEKKINTLYTFADENDDGIIAQNEFDLIFSKFDKSGDGVVTEQEFTTSWVQSFGDNKEVAIAFFKMSDINKDGTLTNDDMKVMHSDFDIDHNGEVTDREFYKKMRLTLNQVPFVVMFTKGDVDGNGRIEQSEMDVIFSRFDTDGDTIVSGAEFVKTWTQRGYSDFKTSKRLFSLLDVNQDGFIDKDTDMKAAFKSFDTDADGELSQEEFISRWQKIFGQIGKGPRDQGPRNF